ncbi:uncharacterized protein LOC114851291 [Betta splendens]|uniref:Uncharacterized protein LOC114851291 n=1 Tax=Betta splendens TaxID=158456 RepID=A0A6P7LX71_BETSP|nr:uncharacterized protein LOC114851291 [Betta splendens]
MASAPALLVLVLACLTATQAQVKVFNLRATGLPSNLISTTDGYVKVFCSSASMGETSVINNNADPWWKEEFSYFKAQENDVLRLEVYDSDFLFDDRLGVCQRQMKLGTHTHDCYLEKGGTLNYSYTLG